MDINSVFPSKFLKAADLQGREVNVMIHHVTVEDVGGQGDSDDTKPVLYFQGKEKGFVLNKTNANTIAGLYGPETDNWKGRAITLFPTQTEFAGKAVACIRVKITAPQMQQPQQNGSAPQQPEPEPVAANAGHAPIDESEIPF